jgi:tetratricopeptide (TPR) repeat protein
MRSSSNREAAFSPGVAGHPFFSVVACAVLLLIPILTPLARAGVSLTEMARREAYVKAADVETRSLFRGYMSLGLFPEAAALLERRVRLGLFPAEAAAPLFEEVVAAQGLYPDPGRLVLVAETAIRNGARTPLILYTCGTGLRGTPGRAGDASAFLAQAGTEGPYGNLAMYSLGQIAAERVDVPKALELFRRVEEVSGGLEGGSLLAKRAARSRAELLLAGGNGPEAAKIFQTLLRNGNSPLDRIGSAAAGEEPVQALEQLPAEIIAGSPLGERVRFLLLLGGLAREQGRYGTAIDALTRAGKELEDALGSASPPSSEETGRSGNVESLRLQLEILRVNRQSLSSLEAAGAYLPRSGVVELLVGLLFADRTVSLAVADTQPPGDLRFLSSGEVGEIIRWIEEVTLGGVEVDRLVEQLAATFDTLQNLGHPIDRYRRLTRLEKGQEEIHLLRERIRERREAAITTVGSARDVEAPLLLRDVGLFLEELEGIRSTAQEIREFTEQYFDILRKKKERAEGSADPVDRAVREAIAYADGRMTALLPVVRELEEMERTAAWSRKIPGLNALRQATGRQLADTLVRQARAMRQGAGEAERERSLHAIGRAVSLLSDGHLAPEDVPEVAVRIGSVLAEGKGRWEQFPGRKADEKEREMIVRILPLLRREGPSDARREEGLYLDSVLRMAVKDPGAGRAAREYLERYPASPLSAGIGVRLGHEALLAGDTAGAVARYGAAAGSGNPEASQVARYMLAWVGFQSGNVDGALRELSPLLSDPMFPCGEPSDFEREAVALAVRAWKDASPERLDSYPPVVGGTCGGKTLLAALWEAEERRGEAMRSAAVRDIAARRFPTDDRAAALEMQAVEALLQAGQEAEAVSRALTLRDRYGPESAWAKSRSAPVAERTRREMAGMCNALAERKFDEGIRSGSRQAHATAAAMMEEYFRVRGEEPGDDDGERILKWAIALLGSGDREGGILLLEELAGEHRDDATGERAALLYAETMVAGYERKESTAEDAEDAALLLLHEQPSGKSVAIGLRASSSFLAAGDFERADSMAGEVSRSAAATPSEAAQANLIRAEAALFEGDLADAREKASLVLAGGAGETGSGSATRAKDLYLLSTLKEIDGMVVSGEPAGAASALEDLAGRFPGAPEVPMYLLRAMRLYAQGGDAEGAIRAGFRFLGEFPRREETTEVAGVIGPLLEERGEFARAGGLYEEVADRFPKNGVAPRFLFHAARIAEEHGPSGAAGRRFSSFRSRYAAPVWMWTYSTLSLGLEGWSREKSKQSIRLMEEGLRKMASGMEDEGSGELAELAGKVRIAIGENWADQFRKTRLVVPLEKSLAIKDRFFRQALVAFEKAAEESPLEGAIQADLLSGDLFGEYGRAILDSQRPKGLKGGDREEYEEALGTRARSYFERSVDWYAGALGRIEEEDGPSDLAIPIRKRLETAQALLEGAVPVMEGRAR